MSASKFVNVGKTTGTGESPWSSIPKWQIALVLGTPLAVGLGYWYLTKGTKTKQSTNNAGSQGIQQQDTKTQQPNSSQGGIGKQERASSNAAAEVLEEEVKDPFKKAQIAKNKGNECFKNGKYAEAIKHYQEAISACPADKRLDISTFYQNKAAAFEQLRNYEAVVSDCTQALQLNKTYTKALNRRAKAYEVLKNNQKCLEDITAVCILEGFQNQSSLMLADRVLKELGLQHAKEAMANKKPIMPSHHFIKTYFASFAEDPVAIRSMSINPDEPAKGFIAALAALNKQDFEAVIPALDEALAENPDNHEATLLKATFSILLGLHEQAFKALSLLINNDAVDVKIRVNALVKRGSMNMQLGKPQESLTDFNDAEKLDAENSDVYHHRGQVNILMDRVEEAIDDFNKAVKYNANFPVAYVQKLYTDYRAAVGRREMDQVPAAMQAFQDAMKKFPTCSECPLLYAQVLSEQGDFKQADEYFEKALELDKTNATAFVHRGLLKLQSEGDVEEAVKMITKAIDLDPKCEFAYETLGTIDVQRGNLKSAIDMFDKAIELARTEIELSHLFSLKDAALAQRKVAESLGVTLPSQA